MKPQNHQAFTPGFSGVQRCIIRKQVVPLFTSVSCLCSPQPYREEKFGHISMLLQVLFLCHCSQNDKCNLGTSHAGQIIVERNIFCRGLPVDQLYDIVQLLLLPAVFHLDSPTSHLVLSKAPFKGLWPFYETREKETIMSLGNLFQLTIMPTTKIYPYFSF